MRGRLAGVSREREGTADSPLIVRFADSFSPGGEAFGAGYSVSPLTSPFHSR